MGKPAFLIVSQVKVENGVCIVGAFRGSRVCYELVEVVVQNFSADERPATSMKVSGLTKMSSRSKGTLRRRG